MENDQIFRQAGLTGNESKVYETLVKHGKLGSTELSSKSGVPYGRIYSVLNSLIEKGLVRVLPEKTKRYTVTSPDDLLKLIDKKQEELLKAREEAKELKGFYESREGEVVQVAYGKKGFWKLVQDLGTFTDYNYNVRYNSEVNGEEIARMKNKKKRGVDCRDLVRYDNETKKDVEEFFKINNNIRKIDNEGIAMAIADNEEVLIGLIKSNATMLVKDKPFAKLMKKMFLETYKNSPEIKKLAKKSKK